MRIKKKQTWVTGKKAEPFGMITRPGEGASAHARAYKT